MIFCNSRLWYSASRGQRVAALSSGESDFYSSIRVAADAPFLRCVFGFALDDVTCVELEVSWGQRLGAGKARHLWLSGRGGGSDKSGAAVEPDLATKALSRNTECEVSS